MVARKFILAAGFVGFVILPMSLRAAPVRITQVGGRVIGRVTLEDGSSGNNLTVDFQSLTTRSLRTRVATNMDGVFDSGMIPGGKYAVTVSRSGFVLATSTLDVNTGTVTYVSIRLERR